MEEWDNYRHWRLLSADIYILVYDVTKQSTFNFIKNLRENILNTRNPADCQFIVAANKMDKLNSESEHILKNEEMSKLSKNIQENINLVRNQHIQPKLNVECINLLLVSELRNANELNINQRSQPAQYL